MKQFKDFITEKKAQFQAAFYKGLYSRNKGIFYRGTGKSTGNKMHDLQALGAGTYYSWDKKMAQAFADMKGGEVKEFKFPRGLKLADAQGQDMAEIKKLMGLQPWEYSGGKMFARVLKVEFERKGYDGVISDKVAEGIVIFDKANRKVKEV